MRIKIMAALAVLLISLGGVASHAQKTKTKSAKPAATRKKSTAQAKKKAPARKAPARRKSVARRAPAPSNQRTPSKERYAEIQEALSKAGFYQGDADGVWKQDSIEALKDFQDASGFEPTGKIDARSLIKLGLGPTYDATTSAAPASDSAEGERQPG
jgi:hypothetical protein